MVYTGQRDSDGFPLQFDSDISEEERRFYLKLFPSLDLVKDKKIHCTSCNIHLGTSVSNSDNVYMHPILKVSQCKKCNEFYNSGEFSKGEDGSELYCRWCGQGGEVYCCAKCPFVFCKACISINLAKSLVADIRDNENWNCFVCSPKITWPIRATHWALKNYIEKQKRTIKNPNLSENKKKRLFKKDSTTCCTSHKAGEESDSSNDSDTPLSKKRNAIKRKRTESSTSSIEEPKVKLPICQTMPKIASVISTNKEVLNAVPALPSPSIVSTANLIPPQKPAQQFLINNNITVQLDNRSLSAIGQPSRSIQNVRSQNTNNIQVAQNTNNIQVAQNTNNIQGAQSAVKIVQLPQQNVQNQPQRIQIQLPGQQTTPPPLLIRNRAVQIRPHVSVTTTPQNINQNQNRTTTTTVQLGVRQTSENSPVYHNIGGFCIDLNSAAQHDSIRLPNGKLIQVKKSTTNNPSTTSSAIRQQIPSGFLTPIQSQPQHQFTITQTSGALPPMPRLNTTISFPPTQSVQQQQPQSIQTVPASTIIPNASGQVQIINNNLIQSLSPNVANQTRPLLVRNVFPNSPIGKARTQLQNQLFSAMEIWQHLINKIHTLTNSNPYKNANSFGDVKELYIHLSYLVTYGIGRLKYVQEKVVEDMTSMGFKTDVSNLASGQPTTEKYSSDGDDDDIEIVEPKTTTINLDSDTEDSDDVILQSVNKNAKASEKTETAVKNKLDNEIFQKQKFCKILPKPGIRLMTPAPWPKTQIMKPKLPTLQPLQHQIRPKLPNQLQVINQHQQQINNQQIELNHQQIELNNRQIGSNIEQQMIVTSDEEFNPLSVLAGMLEVELTEGENTLKPPEPKKPRKKVTTKRNPNLIKKNDIEIEKLKKTDLKLKQQCIVNIQSIDKESKNFAEALKRFQNHSASASIKETLNVSNEKRYDLKKNSNEENDIIEEPKSKMKCIKQSDSYRTIEKSIKENCVNLESKTDTEKIKCTQNNIISDISKHKENDSINNKKDSSVESEKLDGNQIICEQVSTSLVSINEEKIITDSIKEGKQCNSKELKTLKDDKTEIVSNHSEENIITNNSAKTKNERSVEFVKLNEATKKISKTDVDPICTQISTNQSEKIEKVSINTEKTKNRHNEDSKKLNDNKKEKSEVIDDEISYTETSHLEKIDNTKKDKNYESDQFQKLNDGVKEGVEGNIEKINFTQNFSNQSCDIMFTDNTRETKDVNSKESEKSKANKIEKIKENKEQICFAEDSVNQSKKNDKGFSIIHKTEKRNDDQNKESSKLNLKKKEESEAIDDKISVTQISTILLEPGEHLIDKAEKSENRLSDEFEKLIDDEKQTAKSDTEKINFTQCSSNQSEEIDKIANNIEEIKGNHSKDSEKSIDNKEKLKGSEKQIRCAEDSVNQSQKNDKEFSIIHKTEKKNDDQNRETKKLNNNKKVFCKAIEVQIGSTQTCTTKFEASDNVIDNAKKTKNDQSDEYKKLYDNEKKIAKSDTAKTNLTENSSNQSVKITKISGNVGEIKGDNNKEPEKSNNNEKENLKIEKEICCAQNSVNQSKENDTEFSNTHKTEKINDDQNHETTKLNDNEKVLSKAIDDNISSTQICTTQLVTEDNVIDNAKKTEDGQSNESEKLIDDKKETTKADSIKLNFTQNFSNQSGEINRVTDNTEEVKDNHSRKYEKSNDNKKEKLKESKDQILCIQDSANQSKKCDNKFSFTNKTNESKDSQIQESKKLNDENKAKPEVIGNKMNNEYKIQDKILNEDKNLSDIPTEIIGCTEKTNSFSNQKNEEVNKAELLQRQSASKDNETVTSVENNSNSFQNKFDLLSEVLGDIIVSSGNLKKNDSSSPLEEIEIKIDAKVDIIQSEFSKRLNSINILKEITREENTESELTDSDILFSTNNLNALKENLENDNYDDLKKEYESNASNTTLAIKEKYNSDQQSTSVNLNNIQESPSTQTNHKELIEEIDSIIID